MESIDKLREWANCRFSVQQINLDGMSAALSESSCAYVNNIADDIEQEIAELYIELPEGWTAEQAGEVLRYWPRWDDGSPCMFGDEFTCWPTYYHKEEYDALSRLVIYAPDHVWNKGKDDEEPHNGGYYEWNYMRPGGKNAEEWRPTKRKPRTLEDVLGEAVGELFNADISTGSTEWDEVIAKYAEEIRGMMA